MSEFGLYVFETRLASDQRGRFAPLACGCGERPSGASKDRIRRTSRLRKVRNADDSIRQKDAYSRLIDCLDVCKGTTGSICVNILR